MFDEFSNKLRTVRFLIEHRRDFEDFINAKTRDPDAIWRKPGKWYAGDVEKYTSLAADIPGDFAEIGVYRGDTFRLLLPIARSQGKSLHAFDSFQGIDDPGELDWRPRGEFDVGGVDGFRRLLEKRGIRRSEYHAWEGFIPSCFDKAPPELQLSFVLLDVDNYEPTKLGIEWAWRRLNPGGVIALDDFYPGHNGEASLAIKEFLKRHNDFELIDLQNNQLVLRRDIAAAT